MNVKMSTTLEEWIYPIKPLVPQKRTKPMQVLALGLSRMGTESLRRALKILGYEVYHGFDVMQGGTTVRKAWGMLGRRKWGLVKNPRPVTGDDLDEIIGNCDATTDQPCACFALELIEAHPNAKVILNYREEDAWYQSITATFLSLYASWEFQYLSYFDTFLYWRKHSFMYYEQGFFQGSTRLHARRIYKEHRAMVRGSVPKEKLLEWKVEDGWRPLCEFLGKEVPDVDFPHGNTPTQLAEAARRASGFAVRRAYAKVALILAMLLALVVWLYMASFGPRH